MSTPQPPSQPTEADRPAPRSHRLPLTTMVLVGVLLLIPCVALAAVPTYSHESPKLWNWPFFYWYQLLWVFITPALTYLAYVLIQRARGER